MKNGKRAKREAVPRTDCFQDGQYAVGVLLSEPYERLTDWMSEAEAKSQLARLQVGYRRTLALAYQMTPEERARFNHENAELAKWNVHYWTVACTNEDETIIDTPLSDYFETEGQALAELEIVRRKFKEEYVLNGTRFYHPDNPKQLAQRAAFLAKIRRVS